MGAGLSNRACRVIFTLLALGVCCLMSTPGEASVAPAGGTIINVATATYVPAGYSQTETVNSNPVQADVAAVEALVLTQSQAVDRPPNVPVTLAHELTNTGNTPSSYMLNLVRNGSGCSGGTATLAGLKVVIDSNNNGVADPGEPVITLGAAGAVTLKAGQSVALLVQGTTPTQSAALACYTLTATTALQSLSASNNDIVNIDDNGVLSLTKSASYSGLVIPGSSNITFNIVGASIGWQGVAPSATAPGSLATPILYNGAARSLVLIRDTIPAGTTYNPGSLQSTAAGAILMCRVANDPAFSYRAESACGNAAVEVAIGLPGTVVTNGSVEMGFSVLVSASQTGQIVNTAQGDYNNGSQAVESPSNMVVITTTPTSIGLAKMAGAPIVNIGSSGGADGTITVPFTLTVQNQGTTTLYGAQINDVIEGAGTSFGTYTSATVPAAGQYTIVANSLQIAPNGGGTVIGTLGAINPTFTGQSAAQALLASGAILPPAGAITVTFNARINISAVTVGTLYNQGYAQASDVLGGTGNVFATSVNGTNPVPCTTGCAPTPVSTALPVLALTKTASMPQRVSTGVYTITYSLTVTNNGTAPAPNLRLIDNLNCTFAMDLASGQIASWQLVGAPTVKNGVLRAASSFTGNATCDRAGINNTNALTSVPYAAVLSLTDGNLPLAPGQTETVSFTVQITKKPQDVGVATTLTNKAWAATFTANSINLTPAMLVAASSATVQVELVDPMGTVYNSVTRQPVAGAVVTFTPTSTSCGGALTAADIANSSNGGYTFNSNGSVSMTTGTNGVYQFYLMAPPIANVCTYTISITPPAGSGYVVPSVLIPPTAGVYTGCGAVTANTAPPQGGNPTTYYFQVNTGYNAATQTACAVTDNHIPLDPGIATGLVLQKTGSATQASFGDFLVYTLTLTNKTGVTQTGFKFTDTLPPGFGYVLSSAQLNNAAFADPTGGVGPTLTFNAPSLVLTAGSVATLQYRVRIGVGSPTTGIAINRAQASSGPMQSNVATYQVTLSGGVFSTDAYAFGKVYLACRADGIQRGEDEPGIPGVRIYMEDGTFVITDTEGKWSLYGLKPITHVFRVDQSTLPPGAELELIDNRNSGDPASRFADLKNGELHKVNFAVGKCGDTAMLADIVARRDQTRKRGDVEAEARVRLRLDPTGATPMNGDMHALPASGTAGVSGSVAATTALNRPLISVPNAMGAQAGGLNGDNNGYGGNHVAQIFGQNPLGQSQTAQGEGAFATPPSTSTPGVTVPASNTNPVVPMEAGAVELEKLMPDLDNTLGFIGLKDGDTTLAQTLNVRVKGAQDTTLRLTVNGEEIGDRRVGKRATLPSHQLAAWEYIGVELKPGRNTVQLDMLDVGGNVRGTQSIHLIAPDKLGEIHIDVPPAGRADSRTPIPIKVRLTDTKGVPVTARTQLTLEAERGRWVEEDQNPTEPGTQVSMAGGNAVFHLMPPAEPGDVNVRVSAGSLVIQIRLAVLPAMRPMIGVGIVEGVVDFTKRASQVPAFTPAAAAFETELTGITASSDNVRASARTAFYMKGTILNDVLLTTALDTSKTANDTLFRDISPTEFYPVYGDSAVKGFDAQSTGKFYLRLDKDRSSLLYGDFLSSSSAEVRQLSQSNRALNGFKGVYENSWMRATGYASRTSQTQTIDEFRSLGTSGPYYLTASGAGIVQNSELVEILIRDRNQANVVLQSTTMTRFSDYTLDPISGTILFTHPIASVDSNLNPQSIRVTYEVDAGGTKYIVAGVDVQARITKNLQLGVVGNMDNNPLDKRQLGGVTALARIGKHASLAGEVVQTHSDLNGSGTGARAELQYQDAKLKVQAKASKLTAGFDNPASTITAGRTDASATLNYKASAKTEVRGEAIYSKDELSGLTTNGAALSVKRKIGKHSSIEIGGRHSENGASTSQSNFDYGQVSTTQGVAGGSGSTAGAIAAPQGSNTGTTTSVRARVTTTVPFLPKAQVFLEAEDAVGGSNAGSADVAVGGNYALSSKTRLYGRYEFISSLDNQYALNSSQTNNTGVFGIESNYMKDGRVFNEYRLADSIDGMSLISAMGVRNTIRINSHLRATGGVEATKELAGYSSSNGNGTGYANSALGSSVAVTTGLEYMTHTVKATAAAETRFGSDAETLLFSGGLAVKLDPSWSLLGHGTYSDSIGHGTNAGNDNLVAREQLGIAYRPIDRDDLNILAMVQHIQNRSTGSGLNASIANGSTATSGYTDTEKDIASINVNYNPARGTYLTGRYAGELSKLNDGVLASTYWANLVYLRLTRDLSSKWDIGVQGGIMFGQGGGNQFAAGVEVGYQLYRNLWVSGGYNVLGLSDRDIGGSDYTSKGFYLRLRFKFDERTFGFAGTTAPPAIVPEPPVAAPEPATPTKAVAAQPVAPELTKAEPVKTNFQAETLFDTNKATLKAQGTASLDAMVKQIQPTDYDVVIVTGHTDSTGTAAHNQTLSEARAKAVSDYLIAHGLNAARIHARGKGASEPIATNDTPEGRAKNRRVEIEVTGHE